MSVVHSLFALLVAVVVLASSTFYGADNAAMAQTAATEAPLEGAVPGGTTEGGSSDSELWRLIRQGGEGTVAGATPGSGLMIQSQGEDWRQIRNNELPMYSAWAIVGMLILLSLFYAVRGRIKIEHGRSGETISRFNLIERASHWLLASSFIILALTGLNLVFGRDLIMPIVGPDAFASITLAGKYIHNYVGFAFMAAVAVVAILWIKHNFPSRHDLVWFAKGGGLLGMGHPPAKKFNAGQKIIFWVVILCGISISLSGWALLNPFTTSMFAETFAVINRIFGTDLPTVLAPIQEQQLQTLWHSIMAVFMTMVIIAHIYIGSIGMEGALAAMTTGDVDKNWAKEHHSIWVEEVEADAQAQTASAKAQPAE